MGTGSEDILRPLTEDEVEELLLLYRQKYGTSHFHYLLLYNQCKWNRQLRKIESNKQECENTGPDKWLAFRKSFYTHRAGDFRQYGTYISLHVDMMQSVSFNSWEPELKELYECLRETHLIEWTKGPLLTNVYLEYCEEVKSIAAAKGATVQRARTCVGLILDHEQALHSHTTSLPDGFVMRPLQVAAAEAIHTAWVNKKEGSLTYVRGLIELNKTLGVYRKDNDELVAWIFQNDFSGLGILQVLPQVQRMGLGSLLASCLSKIIAQDEQVRLSVWIVQENYKSAALLQKVGYKKSIINEWIQLNKTI